MEKRNANKSNVLFRWAPAKWMKNPCDANLIICQKKVYFRIVCDVIGLRCTRVTTYCLCSQQNNKSKKLLTNRFIYVFVSLFTLAVVQFALLSSICMHCWVCVVCCSRFQFATIFVHCYYPLRSKWFRISPFKCRANGKENTVELRRQIGRRKKNGKWFRL